jgi:hypothetical protein
MGFERVINAPEDEKLSFLCQKSGSPPLFVGYRNAVKLDKVAPVLLSQLMMS